MVSSGAVQAIETGQFPNATFTLSGPIQLPAEAATGAAVDVTLRGDLTLHGLTKHVEIPAQAQLQGGQIQVAGSYTFPWSDFAIEKPNSFSVLSVADQGTLEFKLVLKKASSAGLRPALGQRLALHDPLGRQAEGEGRPRAVCVGQPERAAHRLDQSARDA
ncbi:MAG: YceI family protein [Candidatus Limnocylindrales bacterium]